MPIINMGGGGGDNGLIKELVERTISVIDDDTITTVGQYAYAGCYSLTAVNLPNASRILTYGFSGAGNTVSIFSMPELSSIPAYAFYQTTWRPEVMYLPKCTSYSSSYNSLMASNLKSLVWGGSTSLYFYNPGSVSQFSKLEYVRYTNTSTYVDMPQASQLKVIQYDCSGSLVYYCQQHHPLLEAVRFPNISALKTYGSDYYSYSFNFGVYHELKEFYAPNLLTTCALYSTYSSYFFSWGIAIGGTKISSVYFPLCSEIASYFAGAARYLTNVDLPECIRIHDNGFYWCSNLSEVSLPKCKEIYRQAFRSCSALKSIDLPVCSLVSEAAFWSCSNLETVIFRSQVKLSSYSVFTDCRKFVSLYLLSNAIATIEQPGYDFEGTPISNSTILGYYGSIFVPSALVAAYRATTGWSQFADRITGLTDEEIAAI